MSVLIDKNSKVIVQGFTGNEQQATPPQAEAAGQQQPPMGPLQ